MARKACEYEPLNKYRFYSLLDTYQLIQGQGTSGAKVPPLWGQQKKQTVHWYMSSREAILICQLAVTDFLAVDLELVQTARSVQM